MHYGPDSTRQRHNKSGSASGNTQIEVQSDPSGRYGYGPAHRASEPAGRYASSLTDAEWALIADIFEVTGCGKTPAYSRRLLVDAYCYLVRTGCARSGAPAWAGITHRPPR